MPAWGPRVYGVTLVTHPGVLLGLHRPNALAPCDQLQRVGDPVLACSEEMRSRVMEVVGDTELTRKLAILDVCEVTLPEHNLYVRGISLQSVRSTGDRSHLVLVGRVCVRIDQSTDDA